MALLLAFTGFMVLLIAGDNLAVLFFGWEGIGITSYLLIGYW
jgi:NADH-quinone oxidoreductase subunit L